MATASINTQLKNVIQSVKANIKESYHVDFNLDKLADAVCKYETTNGTKGYGLPPYNNCVGIKKGNIVPCKTGANRMCMFKDHKDSKEAFKKIWPIVYGMKLPNMKNAEKYSGHDKAPIWLSSVLFFYNQP